MFKDYDQVRDPLVLPIHGKKYTIPEVSAEDGITLQRAADTGDAAGITDGDMRRMLLGPVADEMRADGVSASAIRTATLTAYADFRVNREAARIMWESDGNPKAPTRPQDHNTPASTTRRRASGTARTKKKPSPGAH